MCIFRGRPFAYWVSWEEIKNSLFPSASKLFFFAYKTLNHHHIKKKWINYSHKILFRLLKEFSIDFVIEKDQIFICDFLVWCEFVLDIFFA